MRIVSAALFSGTLFLGVLLFLKAGWLLGRARLRSGGQDALAGLGAIETAVYGLAGLLIAFTFTGAAERFEARRALVAQEANAIGTAWQRLDLLDTETGEEIRALFRQYLDSRLATYANARDRSAVMMAMKRSSDLQNAIWTRVSAAAQRDSSPRLASAVLPPINEMFDLANTRTLATQQHPPLSIYILLGFLVLVSALLAGFSMATSSSQSPLHMIGFAAIMSMAIYLILDLEFPRLGFLRADDFDRALVLVRQLMK